MSQLSSTTVNTILILIGPSVALFYSLIACGTLAVTKECTWSSKFLTISLRVALVAAAVGCTRSFGILWDDDGSVTRGIILSVLFLIVSGYFVYMTRTRDVIGFQEEPYYGSEHLKGQTIVITGANQGIGKETTIQLALMGADRIYMLCRSLQRAEAAREEILKEYRGKIQPTQLQIVSTDLGDYSSIRQTVDTIKGREKECGKINVLINNAGLMMGTQTTSKDGHDLMMQANHLGHFLLMRLCMKKDMLTSDARILFISSSTHELCPGIDFDDFFCQNGKRTYALFDQYSMTKLANVMCAKEAGRRYSTKDGILVYAIHPGIVRTNVTSNMQWYWRIPNQMFAWIVKSVQKSPREGAFSQVFCAAAPRHLLPPSGSYINNGQQYPSSKASESLEDAKRLWEISEEYVGVSSNSGEKKEN